MFGFFRQPPLKLLINEIKHKQLNIMNDSERVIIIKHLLRGIDTLPEEPQKDIWTLIAKHAEHYSKFTPFESSNPAVKEKFDKERLKDWNESINEHLSNVEKELKKNENGEYENWLNGERSTLKESGIKSNVKDYSEGKQTPPPPDDRILKQGCYPVKPESFNSVIEAISNCGMIVDSSKYDNEDKKAKGEAQTSPPSAPPKKRRLEIISEDESGMMCEWVDY